MKRINQIHLASIIVIAAVALAACGDGNQAPASTATTVALSPTVAPPTATIAPSTSTPSAAPIDPCTLRTSLEGQPLVPGPSFALDAGTEWQLCIGGAAAGSSEKYLFHTTDGGIAWTLISRTTLGNPTPEPGVGDLPNGNAVSQILFLDDTHGWMGLTSPGVNLWRSQDGGVNWTEVPVIPPAVPVTSITFTDAMHGTVVTPEGNWTTTDGGNTWTQ